MTLLKSVSGLIVDVSGEICFEGHSITNLPPNEIVGKGISQVPEGIRSSPASSVADNSCSGRYLHFKRKNMPVIRERLDAVYGIFPASGSGEDSLRGPFPGERQMVAISRALMASPRSCCSTSLRWDWLRWS